MGKLDGQVSGNCVLHDVISSVVKTMIIKECGLVMQFLLSVVILPPQRPYPRTQAGCGDYDSVGCAQQEQKAGGYQSGVSCRLLEEHTRDGKQK
jgi:hypothetical protein